MPPPDPNTDPEAQTDFDEHQAAGDDDAERQRGDNTSTQGFAKKYGDPSGKLWSMYLTEAKEEDDQITKKWTEDTGGVLVFTGLFSAIVAAFILESYKKLSPDSGDQTVALLTQLVDISTGAPVVVQSSPPFKPPAYIVRVNVMWFSSLVLSLSCALLATLMQQWARNYLQYARYHGTPRKRARMRAYMYDGVQEFGLPQVIELMPLEIHLSVFLFLAGLIDFFFHVNKVVAFFILGLTVNFALVYAQYTVSPLFFPNHPCRTPLTETIWASWQLSARLSDTLTPSSLLGVPLRVIHVDLGRQFTVFGDKLRTFYKRFEGKLGGLKPEGLRRRAELAAMEAPSRVDASALHWTLTTLDQDTQFENFAACMPGFFDSRADLDATPAMLSLMSDQSAFDLILGSRLQELLYSCLPGTSHLTKEQREYRLRVCLKSLWYCLRAYNQPENSRELLSSYVHAVFASPQVIDWIQTEQDPAVRLLGRCFGSLIAKKLANDFTSPTRTSISALPSEMACLSRILGASGERLRDWLGQECAIDIANIISLTSGEIVTLVTNGTKGVQADVVDVFGQTLSILTEGVLSSANLDHLPPDQVVQFREIYPKLANARLPNVLKERLRHISDRLPS